MRKNALTKARRLPTEGRLAVLHVGDGDVTAACKDDRGEVHRVTYARACWTELVRSA
jgi:hypothetical protein